MACASAVASARFKNEPQLVVDDQRLYAIDFKDRLVRAPLDGESSQEMRELVQLPGGVHRIEQDARYLWIATLGADDHTLLRVDKTTGGVDRVADNLWLWTFTLDGDYVYWVPTGTGEPDIVRRRKDGGMREIVVPNPTAASGPDLPHALTISNGKLYATANRTVAPESGPTYAYDEIYTIDLVTRERTFVGRGPTDGTLTLLGPHRGSLYAARSTKTATEISRWPPEPATSPEMIVRVEGELFASVSNSIRVAGDHLWIARDTLTAYPLAGGEPKLVADHQSSYTGRFTAAADVAYVLESASEKVFRVPLASAPARICE